MHNAGHRVSPLLSFARVTVSINTIGKHSLPVSPDCPWNHPHSVSRENQGCMTAGGDPVANYDDVRQCMRESACDVNDERLQMVVLRDPRPVTVSSYYHQMIYYNVVDGTVDEYVVKMLPTISQWLTIRHILFEEMMAEQSTVFWYEDAIGDPLTWHERWYESVGLRLPASVVEEASRVSSGDGVSTYRMPHPGGADATADRSYKDEISFGLNGQMDDILRAWLPPSFLVKIGVD